MSNTITTLTHVHLRAHTHTHTHTHTHIHTHTQVLQSLTNTDTTFCPTRQLTEQKREALRVTKCLPPPSTTAQELAELFRLAVRSSSQLHSSAFAAVTQQTTSATSTLVQCPFEYLLYNSCDVASNLAPLFTPSDEFQANISFAGLGVILAPAIEDLLGNGSLNLNMYTSNQVWKSSYLRYRCLG